MSSPAGCRPIQGVDELEAGGIRSVCEPYFDRPLKEISLGMVLMRLFQISRRFNVEIQPQLVLLQKTLLNIEGLGATSTPSSISGARPNPFPREVDDRPAGAEEVLGAAQGRGAAVR